jgi:hypothetical protein
VLDHLQELLPGQATPGRILKLLVHGNRQLARAAEALDQVQQENVLIDAPRMIEYSVYLGSQLRADGLRRDHIRLQGCLHALAPTHLSSYRRVAMGTKHPEIYAALKAEFSDTKKLLKEWTDKRSGERKSM